MAEAEISERRDESEIRALEAAYDAAWRIGDVDRLLACLSERAVLVNPLGEAAIGTEAIRKLLGAFLAGAARDSVHTTTITRISIVTSDVAVVDGEATVETAARSVITHRFTDVVVRRDGRWLIEHVRAYGLGGDPALS